MGLISQSIKNLKGGVSQQPDILRYPDQGALQVNGWSSETEGLQKRPPLLFVKTLGDKDFLGEEPLVHLINRDAVEQYYAVFTGEDVKIFGLDGKQYTVSGDVSYLKTNKPREDLRMVTVADFTFIVNRKTIVKKNEDKNDNGEFEDQRDALINVRGGQYGRTFTININGEKKAEMKMPDGSEPKHSVQTDAQYIAEELAKKLKESLGETWEVTVGQGYIHIVAPQGTKIEKLEVNDGFANQLLIPVTHYSQSFNKLPLEAPNGYKVKIVGTSDGTDQYYVEYNAERKVWKEAVGWNTEKGLDWATMPHTLVRQADGSFKFSQHDWDDRRSGDDDTNPHPSLVGQSVNDIFFFRNRLGMLAGENIVMSRTGKYFNFYPNSVANLSDDDPIDVAISHNRISVLKYAVPFSEELLLWSDQAQFVLTAGGVLSNKTVELNLTTEFDVSDGARPFGLGRNVYFASPRSSFTSINRYYAVQDVSQVKNAEDMTAHVPSYIPNGVFSIHGSSTENFVSVLSSGAKGKVFIYKYLYLDEEIQQQSWSHWDFGDNVDILASASIASDMYLLMRNEHNVWIAKISFIRNTKDYAQEPYRVYLDNKITYTIPDGSYNDDLYETTIDIRNIYGMKNTRGAISVVEQDGRVSIFEPDGGWATQSTINLTGNLEGATVVIGFNIPFRYEFSKFLIKLTAEDGSTKTEDLGRLQLRRAWVNYEQSGAFDVEVENTNRIFRYNMAGARLGSSDLRATRLNLGTGQFRFPITGNALYNTVRITSDNTTPLNVIGCGWEANFVRRSSSV